jgi:hypothetical protein
MSRSIYFVILTLFVVSVGYAQGINGKWKGQMESPNGPMDLTFNFKVSGDSLSGTVESPMGELPISNAKKKGKTFSFDVDLGEFKISHLCTAMGDSILMKVPGMEADTLEIILKPLPEVKTESR